MPGRYRYRQRRGFAAASAEAPPNPGDRQFLFLLSAWSGWPSVLGNCSGGAAAADSIVSAGEFGCEWTLAARPSGWTPRRATHAKSARCEESSSDSRSSLRPSTAALIDIARAVSMASAPSAVVLIDLVSAGSPALRGHRSAAALMRSILGLRPVYPWRAATGRRLSRRPTRHKRREMFAMIGSARLARRRRSNGTASSYRRLIRSQRGGGDGIVLG